MEGFFSSKINYLKKGINITTSLVEDVIFLFDFRTKETYFTRIERCKMNFKGIILFIISFVKRSLQIELDEFSQKVYGDNINISKQAFSQARRIISPKAFVKMLDEITKWFYKETPFKTYHGYRLLAIDGTVLALPNTEELREVYGYIENQNAEVARARASALYDIENDMIIASQITHYRCGEREIAEGLIEDMVN